MTTVYLGNTTEEGQPDAVTHVDVPSDKRVGEVLKDVADLWGYHAAVEGSAPAWVASDDEVVAAALAQELGCPVRPLEHGAEQYLLASGSAPVTTTEGEQA